MRLFLNSPKRFLDFDYDITREAHFLEVVESGARRMYFKLLFRESGTKVLAIRRELPGYNVWPKKFGGLEDKSQRFSFFTAKYQRLIYGPG
ncbi:MAG: hypothetical protein JWN64_141 [Parcubacteria group bacterium]|nr:hypothetical protein [Parcubacteria group bacterium]